MDELTVLFLQMQTRRESFPAGDTMGSPRQPAYAEGHTEERPWGTGCETEAAQAQAQAAQAGPHSRAR